MLNENSLTSDEKLLARKISDLIYLSDKQYKCRFSFFLNEREQIIAQDVAERGSAVYCFYGGYEGSSRVIMGVSPDGNISEEIFPVEPLTFHFRSVDKLTHRDFLGAFMSLDIKRELIGDILVGDGYAIVFTTGQATELIMNEIIKIGKVGVKTERGITMPFPEAKYEMTDGVVSSLRLDCIVCAVTNLSREKSAQLIRQGNVQLNHFVCDNVSEAVSVDDVLSVRGYGRFEFNEVGTPTKKNRLHVKIKKYI